MLIFFNFDFLLAVTVYHPLFQFDMDAKAITANPYL